ncbi:DUF4386 family protein [Candidatus Chloroploca sp. M-50]|uniref:DUF4386 family protein n=1 Tax=Candidatus Chloroploca mongolica TaxID=2528176 RepID=A0ABS4D3Z2_9CHLR|nr:DUF4386 family protein [Candidatus Chloroploca mongolica]MBP1464152.1 DUF4386 family protein [Candidatus Chloroploca mongolica]
MMMAEANWKSIYRLGAVAALLAVVFAVLEILITFVPGGERVAPELLTVPLWFARLQANPLLELRNLGLINIFLTMFGVLLSFALFAAHRTVNPGWAGLALVIAAIGGAVFFATNRSFAMLALSNRYATATDDAQRAALVAAGEAMLAVGESHTPGTFLAFALSLLASLLMAWVLLRGGIFSRASAYVGMLGFGFLLVFEILSVFVPALFDVAMIFAMIGGIASIVWYFMVARRLFQLAKMP